MYGIARLQITPEPIRTNPLTCCAFLQIRTLVDGQPITDFVELKGLNTTGRLTMLSHICEAVHHAHQKGVIHRDLKPANILVDSAGQPKILDFGVARATASDVGITTIQTHVGQVVGTIAYMSPEQALGDPSAIDIRSDVYALGVIAFELLTGRLPLDVSGRPISEGIRAICDEEPKSLSSYDRTLRGDLETIVAKALEKNPHRRYQSAAALAADIECFLTNQPIQARRASTWYQVNRFARRHKALVGATGTVIMVLLVAVAVSTAFAIRARVAQVAAQKEALRATAVSDALKTILESANPSMPAHRSFVTLSDLESATYAGLEGSKVTVADLIRSARGRIESMLVDTPETQLDLWEVVANTQLALGQLVDAEDTARLALDRHTTAVHNEPKRGNLLHVLAQSLALQGRTAEAESVYRDAVTQFQTNCGPQCERTLRARYELAELLVRQGRFNDGLEIQQSSCTELERTLGPHAPLTLEHLVGYACLQWLSDQSLKAKTTCTDALARIRGVHGSGSIQAADAMDLLAGILPDTGQLDEAADLAAESLAITERLFGRSNPLSLERQCNVASIRMMRGECDAGAALYRRAISELRILLFAEHPSLLTALNDFAFQLAKCENSLDEAEGLATEALNGYSRIFGHASAQALDAQSTLATVLQRGGRCEEALACIGKLLAAAGETRLTPAARLETLLTRALCFVSVGQSSAAEECLLLIETEIHDEGPDPEYYRKQVQMIRLNLPANRN